VDGTGFRRDAQNNQNDHLDSESSLSFRQLLNHMSDFNRRSFTIVLSLSSMGESGRGVLSISLLLVTDVDTCPGC